MTERKPSRELYLDIDETLASGVVYRHMRLYNRILKLGMSKEQITEAGSKYRKTFDVPEIISFRAQGEENEKCFQQVRSAIRVSKALHRTLEKIHKSQPGVFILTHATDNQGYYTVRPEEMREPTKQWLKRKGFYKDEKVVICTDHKDKLEKILSNGQPDSSKILIDDSLDGLVKAATQINGDTKKNNVLQNLTLVGFGYTQEEISEKYSGFTEQTGVRLLALPNWETDNVLKLLENMEE